MQNFCHIDQIVDSDILNNLSMSQFLCPSRVKSTIKCLSSVLISFDFRAMLENTLIKIADDDSNTSSRLVIDHVISVQEVHVTLNL
jgi:uncharacterized membrane protein